MFDKLDPPHLDVLSVTEKIKKSYIKQTGHYKKITSEYENKLKNYEEEYFNNRRYRLVPIDKIDKIDKKSANHLYNDKIVSQRLGNLYDNILMEKTAFCPVCGANGDTLDHVLPKNFFVQYTLTPINMVPMCGRCNRLKKDFYSNEADKEIFHPYFDDYSKLTGLCATFKIKKNNFIPIFYLDESLAERKWIYNFTYIFELNNVLSAVSSQKISNMLNTLRKTKDMPKHKSYCNKCIENKKNDMFNTPWENVLYDLILNNFDDFYRII